LITKRIQVIDCDYIVGSGDGPIIRIFGKDLEGKSCCVYYKGFYPYFYVKTLDDREKDVAKTIIERFKGIVANISLEEKYLPIGFQKSPSKVLKITVHKPTQVKDIRDDIKKIDGVEEVYEADILFKYRFLIDYDIWGFSWIEVRGNYVKTTLGKVDYEIEAEKIRTIEENGNAPLKILSFDIECIPRDLMSLPDPSRDPIVIISLAFYPPFMGNETKVLVAKYIKRANSDIECFESEEEMLKGFINVIEKYDPDIITGFNILNFDFPYIVKRLKNLNISRKFGRVEDKNVTIRSTGENNKVSVPGRVVVDVRALVKADFHLKRYTLEHVAEKLINEGKLDVDYRDIPRLWMGKSRDINRLVDYARKDAILPLKILLEKRLLDKYFELSKVSGLLLQDVISGGQSSRVEGLLLRYGKKRNLIIPCKPSQEEIRKRSMEREKLGLKGAIVLEPKVSLYHGDNMILVLDFRSLYPSLIMAYNICFTTLLKDGEEVKKYIEVPTRARFVTKDIKEGLLPEILKDLMNFRVAVKKTMKAEEDPERKRQLDAKQLALKIMMNSFYGYTGYLRARVYSLDVANAITALGRYTIEFTRKIIEEKYGLETIYGDTDSVLIKINTSSLEEATKIGEKISKEISRLLPQPMLLEFEKIYKSFLLLSKKRYAGWMFEKTQNGEWKDKIDTKGIETVRREWCDLVGEVVDKVINMLLKQPDVNLVVNYVRDVLQKLKQGKIPIEKLIMTRTLSKPPKAYKAKQPHAYLALKLAKRSPGSAPTIGERIPFVIVKGKGLIAERAEDPKYVQENKLEIDANYYIEKQLLPPIERILKPLGITRQELLSIGVQRELTKFVSPKEEVEEVKPIKSVSPFETILECIICPHCKNSLKFKDIEKRFCSHCFSEINPRQLLEDALDAEIHKFISMFLTQPLICMNCKSSLRRPPLTGKCPTCGSNNLVMQINTLKFEEKIKMFEQLINERNLVLPKKSLEILKTYSTII